MWREVPDQKALEAETAELIMRGFSKPNWHEAWASGAKFVDRSPVHRFQGRYIEATVPDFERRWVQHFREWLFRTFLSDVSVLYEFGAGSARNLMAWREQFPDKGAVALDYAPSAVALAHKARFATHLFDFARPSDLSLSFDGGALTFCALEQVADPSAFIDYLRASKIKRVVHVEPIVEWYTDSPFDRLAQDYHLARGYVRGLPGCLPSVKYERRMGFGSRFHEGYSVIVWEPT